MTTEKELLKLQLQWWVACNTIASRNWSTCIPCYAEAMTKKGCHFVTSKPVLDCMYFKQQKW